MNYYKGLKYLREQADTFDYDTYLEDKEAGKFDVVEKKDVAGREGLMRRNPRVDTTQVTEDMMEEQGPPLGSLAERYIQMRRKRKSGSPLRSMVEAYRKANKGKAVGEGGDLKTTDSLRSPHSSKDADSFISKLEHSESSGRDDAEIQIKDGRKFAGRGQFGEARLADFKKATGMKFTQEEFKKDPELQSRVMKWHIADIDKSIEKVDPKGRYDRDGLRAVAHLGGVGGMKRWVASGGTYNPSDELGTSLSKYYNKFKG